MKDLYVQWNVATSKLSWGVQKVFRDAFQLVSEGKVTLVWGADYSNGSPCLVNSVASMLTTSGGHGIPSTHFGEVVGLFNRINRQLMVQGVNKDNNVSPLAADIFLRYFAPEQPEPIDRKVDKAMESEAFANCVSEPTDEDMAKDWLNALNVEATCEAETVSIKQDAKAQS